MYEYKNWMGHTYQIGDSVFYCTGGSYPSFRVGRIESFKESKKTYSRPAEVQVRVAWEWERHYDHSLGYRFYVPAATTLKSTLSAEVISPVPDSVMIEVMQFRQELDRAVRTVV